MYEYCDHHHHHQHHNSHHVDDVCVLLGIAGMYEYCDHQHHQHHNSHHGWEKLECMNGSTWPARSLLRYISPITIVIIVIVLILLCHRYRPYFAAFMLIIPILLHQGHHCQQCIHFVNFFAYLLDSKSAEGFHKTGFCTFNQ